MILYGSKAVHLLTAEGSPETACPVCGTEGQIEYQVFRRHAHVYWLPLFPLNKVGVAQCNHCFKAFEKKDMSEDMRFEYQEVKKEAKGKWWQWTGVFLILAFVAFMFVGSLQSESNLKEHLQSPEVGDVYEFQFNDEEHGQCYSLMKVLAVEGDSLKVVENQYQVTLRSGLDEIDVDSNYYHRDEDVFKVAKEEIQAKYDEGVILGLK